MLLGNDVIDLRDAMATGKERDQRFLERVFTPLEREAIQNALDPALALWMLWAGKESLFKVAAKLEPGTIFAHADFSLRRRQLERIGAAGSAGEKLELATVYRHYSIQLRWEWNAEFVHCTAGWGSAESGVGSVVRTEEVQEEFLSAREEESTHSPESRKVRALAKQLLRERLALRSPEVIRRRESAFRFHPPVVLENGEPARGVDLSLSHDGRFVAAVIYPAR